MENFFEVKNVTFSSSKSHKLNNVSFNIPKEGQIVSLLGPSGVGKTTILRTIAGLEKIENGEIWLDKTLLSSKRNHLQPEERNIALSFQDNCLFPHLNVLENLKLGLKRKGPQKKLDIFKLIDDFYLNKLVNKYPHQISSGEAQRVSLIRSLLSRPKLLLLDEPFSNIDQGLKEELQIRLKKILNFLRLTTLIVTHNYDEAFYFGNKCGLFIDNKLEQYDLPYKIYHFPNSEKVANFFNKGIFVNAQVVSKNSLKHPKLGLIKGNFVNKHKVGEYVKLLIQPEDLIHNDSSKMKFKVVDKRFVGTNFIYILKISHTELAPVLVHSHHIHQHSVNEFFGVKTPIVIKHLVCF
ncbi:MAG: iron ABC transporter [Rickettsiales bacterium]|nr:iron ABC transporter [Rickettsiales bacterium]